MARKELGHSPCSYPAMKVDPGRDTDNYIYPVVRFDEDGIPHVFDPVTNREIAVANLHLKYDANNVARVEMIQCLMYREPKQDGGKKGG